MNAFPVQLMVHSWVFLDSVNQQNIYTKFQFGLPRICYTQNAEISF